MATNTRLIDATTDKVWAVLADGWLYPLWVVGTTHMREVDDHWPAVGAKLHHRAGVWPLTTDDNTEVLDVDSGRSLRLRARGWPAGEANVLIRLTPEGTTTRIELNEDAVRGPGRLIPSFLRQPLIRWRNVEALERLANIAEGR